jgi:phosphotransferase system enzyme I (PtsI)
MVEKLQRNESGRRLVGTPLSPGIGAGRAYRIEQHAPDFHRLHLSPAEAPRELERLQEALAKSRDQLVRIKERFEQQLGKEHSYIIDAHRLILEDREFLDQIRSKIRDHLYGPERAVWEATEEWLAVYRTLTDPFFRDRGSDLEEVARRIVANLGESGPPRREEESSEDLILVGSEIGLSDLASFPLSQVKGLVSMRGGQTSHITIIARVHRIPAVSGVREVEGTIRTGDEMIVDGSEGIVLVQPSAGERHSFQVLLRQQEQRRSSQLEGDSRPSRTADGRVISVLANTDMEDEATVAFGLGAEGIGLFRSEFVYMGERSGPVRFQEQLTIYRRLARLTGRRPAVIRTLDMGTEDHPYFSRLAGGGPVLGLRGIRLSLDQPHLFRDQVRAIVSARTEGNLRILLPMISSADELVTARELIRQVEREVSKETGIEPESPIQVGAMIEVPSAVLVLDGICRYADFVSVGSNDLIQFTLAVDRSSDVLSPLFNPLHPAILKSLERVARVASENRIPAYVCGEVAAQPLYAYLLIGMGFQRLSMNPFSISTVKKRIREMVYEEARERIQELLEFSTIKEVERFVKREMPSWETVGQGSGPQFVKS